MNSFWNWWNSLTPTVREGIIIGLIGTVIGGLLLSIFTGFWKLVGKAFLGSLKLIQRFLNWKWPPASAGKPAIEPSTIKTDALPVPPQPKPPAHLPETQDTISSAYISQIPRPPLVGFVARRDDEGRDIVGRLKEELAPRQNQLVTLSGPGGIGKTTLAAEAARELQAAYGGRVVWSSADGRTDFTLPALLDEIATQLGRPDVRMLAAAAKEEQVRALVAAPPALVVLDNYETIAGEEQSRIEAWFKTAQCSALFTSRQRIADTILVTVSAMSREEAEEFLEKLAGQTQDPQIFSPEVRRSVYETAEANPYVMQWVVGQIDLAQEPGAVLEELRQGEGDAARRVFDRSFELPQLGEDGRDALLALSLFAPSATPAALSAVAGFDDAERTREAVKNLRRLWLVKGVDDNRRLTIEGLTRTLADARLSRDTRADEFRRRFVAYFLSYAEERGEQTPENYDALEEERDNLLRAAEAAFASGDWGSVMQMAYALVPGGMLFVRGYWDEAVRLSEQALLAARSSQDETRIASLSHNIAVMYLNRGEISEARRLYDQSLEISERLGNQSGVATTLHQLAMLAQNTGDLIEARRLYGESLEIKKRLGDQSGVAITLHQLAILAHDTGDLIEARRLYDQSLEISERLGNQSGVATTLHQLAMLAQDQGEIEEARRLYGESLEIKKRLGDRRGVAITLHELGRLAQNTGDLIEARRLYDQSLEISERLGDQSGVAITLHQLAMLVQGTGEIEEARRLYGESLEIEKRLGDQSGVAISLNQLGRLAYLKGELEEARRLYGGSLEIKKRLGDQSGVANTLHNLGKLAEDDGDKAEAARLFREALSIFERLRSPNAEIVRESLARVEGGSP